MDFLQQHIHPHHIHTLLTDGVLRFDKDWNEIQSNHGQPTTTSNQPNMDNPHMLFFVLQPDNLSIPISQGLDPALCPTWYHTELSQIDKQKESIDECFSYLKRHELRTMLKVHDNPVERWSQFSTPNHTSPQHTFLYMKVWDEEMGEYLPCATLGFTVKEVNVAEKLHRIGYIGSGWVNTRYRMDGRKKYVLWVMAAMMLRERQVRYCYAHVFAENSKSLGYISKSGMSPTRFRLVFVGLNCELNHGYSIESLPRHVRRLKTIDEYSWWMERVYGKGHLLLETLSDLYNHANFMGCFIDTTHHTTFQVWKCKHAEDRTTKQVLPAYEVFNVSSSESSQQVLDRGQCESIVKLVTRHVIPYLCRKAVAMDEQPQEKVNVVFVMNEGTLKEYLIEKYGGDSSISFASLYYTFQDNFRFLGRDEVNEGEQTALKEYFDASSMFQKGNVFNDIRDCTGKPMVWDENFRTSKL